MNAGVRNFLILPTLLAVGLFLGSCASSTNASPTAPVITTNIYTYYYTRFPAVRAYCPSYYASVGLSNDSTNFEFELIFLSGSPYALIPPGTYYPCFRAWTNTAVGYLATPWVFTNAVTFVSFSNYVLTVNSSATDQIDFSQNPDKSVITVKTE